MRKPRLLDLFCGAGGCSAGYAAAGFDVTGVDIDPQRRYPYTFFQSDWASYLADHWREYDVIHASPPCQKYSRARSLSQKRSLKGAKPHHHPDLVGPVRDALIATGKPYVIENVVGAPLENPLMLCGTMFGLGVFRHRMFETNPLLWWPPGPCRHDGGALPMWWKSRQAALRDGKKFSYMTVAGNSYLVDVGRAAMQIGWMSRTELSQAIPPAYTEYVGMQILEHLS